MSDTSQGPGWWQASDGKWYPPEQAPGAGPAGPPPGGPPPGYGTPPAYGAPAGGPPTGVGVGDIVGYGWKKFQEHLGAIIVAVLIYVVIIAVFLFLGNIISTAIDSVFGSLLFSFLQILVFSAVSIILIRAVLMIVDGKQIDNAALFSSENLGPYIIGAILYSLGTLIGTILCILPGIIFAFLGYYWNFYVVDKGLEPVEAIKASINLIKDNVGTVLVWAIVAWLLTAVGIALCCVGYLVAAPVVFIGNAYLFRRLNNEPVAP
ncbi:hypothetical protein ACE2AJ_00945 [Aquihabitans daechungensis]|uniref:hypothetical protein n=1 Tax=Aquihabitans daechungensis TaxID=1052257 RepID=UPI003BA35E18